ncbi:MAG TPA: ABC transporter permease [Chryseosolibacter sp.]|nr:ABC transporter permease [Chryseosolibacter sp.]
MLKNYLKVAFRSIQRSKLTAFINIAGLALAMACSLLILLFITDELSYDRYHSKADRIYRMTRNFLSPDGTVNLHLGHLAPPFGPLLKNDFPDFEEVARTLQSRVLIAREENGEQQKLFNENNTFFAEPQIFKVFDIDVVAGNADKALTGPFQLMLSEKTAKKYFGDEPALGKSLRASDRYNMVVSGVFRDFPAQSHWHPDVLVSFSTLNDSTVYGRYGLEHNWGNNAFSTYVLVKEPFDQARAEHQFPAFLDRHMGADMNDPTAPMPSKWTTLFMQKLTDIHLHSHLDSEIEANGDINTVYMMAVIGIFIILIACFNFVNLSTARATKRAKEVGLRKVVGALRAQLVIQYLSESIVIALLSFVCALAIATLALPWLNAFTGKHLALGLVNNLSLIGILLLSTLVIGTVAGIYPAFVISSFRPSTILKGQQGSTRAKTGLRKVLVVSQFAISIVLIIATLVTFRQLQYMNTRSLGYDRDQVVALRYYGELNQSYDAFYNELLRGTDIQNVARSSRIPTGRLLDSRGTAQVQQGDSLMNTNVVLKNIAVDQEFFDTYGIPFVAGRNFSKAIKTDDSLSFVLNEAAVRMIGMTPEEILKKDFQYFGVRGRVIGVVRDFHFESLREPIVPMVFHIGGYGNISVKVAGNRMRDALADMEKIWKEFLPHRPFEYQFLSMQYAQLYDAERKQGQLFIIFSGLAIFIASLGLFGLATFNTLQRIKEIGIRKVLGASVGNIVRLLSREIMMLIVIANIIAWPVAWYFTSEWLKTFAYRIDNSFLLYLFSAVAAILIALITVGSQTIRAALSNPADTLRNE